MTDTKTIEFDLYPRLHCTADVPAGMSTEEARNLYALAAWELLHHHNYDLWACKAVYLNPSDAAFDDAGIDLGYEPVRDEYADD